MNILGISGSPRKNGNTEILLDAALAGASSSGASVKKIILNDLDFKPCQECAACHKTGLCPLRDDMRIIYREIERADAVVVASPIFFGSLSAQTKMMVDRFNCAWARKYILKKRAPFGRKRKGLFLCVSAAEKPDFFENAKAVIKIFFLVLDIGYFREVYCGGIEQKGAIKKKKDIMSAAFKLGAKLAKE